MRINKISRYILNTTYYILLITLLCGCATTTDTTSGPLKSQSILKFSDIPVPVGLKPLPLESYSFESSGVRAGVLKYSGKLNPDLVTNFYKDQMPSYNWNLINIIEYGQRLMNFERETETCIITIFPKGSLTILTISLGPKSQATARRAKQLIR